MATIKMNTNTAKPKVGKRCKHCKKRYTPLRATSQYCSDSCRVLACNQRKKEEVREAARYEDSMRRSLRWHRKQDHLHNLSDDDLKAHIEGKWASRKEIDAKRRAAARERYASRKAALITSARVEYGSDQSTGQLIDQDQ